MELAEYRKEIQLKLTGDLLEFELDDNTIDDIINAAKREIQRYYTSTNLITVPYKDCIRLNNPADTNGKQLDVSSVIMIYRTEDLGGNKPDAGYTDPMQAAQWQVVSGMGNLTNFQDAVWNYGAWTTLEQIKNTLSTDLSFRFDKSTTNLYINISTGTPNTITIEYIPVIKDVSEITSDYWIDMLMQLSVALTKITVGRIRSRYTQSNALWTQDGDSILAEGREELNNLREKLLANSELTYPID